VNLKDSELITGTIVNNSTKDTPSARIYTALYDKDNRLVTTEAWAVNIASLTPTFTISLVNIQIPDHYTLMPGGTP